MTTPNVVVQRAPDGWTHIGGPGMHLLIGLDEDDERTLVASDHADGGDLDDVIDYLTAGGMRRAHHFVGVHWVPSTRVVAFGPVVATVTLADGSEREIRPASPRVWTDLELDVAPERVALRVLDEDERSQPPVPVPVASDPERGDTAQAPAVRAAEAAVTSGPRPAPTAVASTYAAEPAEPVAAPFEGLTEGGPTEGGPTEGGPTEGGRTWSRDWAAAAEARAPASSPPPPVAPAAPVAPTASHAAPPSPVTSSLSTVPTGSTGSSASGPVATPSYDHLFGQTTDVAEYRRHLADLEEQADPDRPTQGADPVPAHGEQVPQPSQDVVAPPVSSAPAGPSSAAPTVPSSADHPAGHGPRVPTPTPGGTAPTATPGLISSVPWARSSDDAPSPSATPGATAPASTPSSTTPTPASPATPEVLGRASAPAAEPTPAPEREPARQDPSAPTDPAPGGIRTPASAPSLVDPDPAQADPRRAVYADEDGDDGEDDRTVDRSALLSARDAARQQVGSGPRVLAVLCEQGHASPPHDERCRVCGAGIPRQEPFAIPRPPLGVLRLSTGDVVALDRSVLLGRSPRTTDGVAPGDRPHLVKVPSPERDVSRNHVEVLLDGWHVLVRDLGTTNGTTVALPGQQPVRMRANDRQVLEPGSVVSMADEVSFTFEVRP